MTKEQRDKIDAWLKAENPDHFEGLSLLRPWLANKTLLDFIGRSDGIQQKQHLRYQLEKVLERFPPHELEDAEMQSLPAKPDNQSKPDAEDGQKPANDPPAGEDGGSRTPADEIKPESQNEGSSAADGQGLAKKEGSEEQSQLQADTTEPKPEAGQGDGHPGKDPDLAELTRLFLARADLSNKLADCKTDQERKDLVDQIKNLTEQHTAIAGKIDAKRNPAAGQSQTGDSAIAAPKKVLDDQTRSVVADLKLQKMRAQAYRKKVVDKKIHKKLTDEERATLVAQKDTLIEDLETQIKKLEGE